MTRSRWSGVARTAALAAVGVLASATLAACGDDPNAPGGGGGGDSEGGGSVGVILPDAETSPRWENNDRPSLEKAFDGRRHRGRHPERAG